MSRSFFDSDNGMADQIRSLTAKGKTVFVSKGVWKIKFQNDTIEFKEFYRRDESMGRAIVDGGFYATDKADEIAHIKSLRDVACRVYEPIAEPVVEPDASIAPVEVKAKK